jgi:hypothetical protein
MKMPEDYQIPDDPDAGRMDAAYLRTCLGLRVKPGEEPQPLPTAVRQAHFLMARALSVLGAMGKSMTPTQLATVVAIANVEPQEPEPPKRSFLDESPVEGQKVVIHWRRKDQPAHFLGVTPDGRVLVLHNGSEVRMRPDLVRHPEPDEFPDVADNINQTAEV